MAEMWKPVPSKPGVLASSMGRILLPPRHTPMANGGYRLYEPKPVVGVLRKALKNAAHTYYGIWTSEFGNLKCHQLVCEAFHGAKPFDAAVVIHRDECGTNNVPDNLRWGTQKENLNSPKFLAYCSSRGSRRGLARAA